MGTVFYSFESTPSKIPIDRKISLAQLDPLTLGARSQLHIAIILDPTWRMILLNNW
jgi:hypothetical protein